ncbi:MAG: hypothetical protein KKH06_01410, partial [Gammaproteobacteria bacterium]|nr:hypothetical protein [Gammaproteobacteria bacterium]
EEGHIWLIGELTHNFRFNDAVLRHLIIRRDSAITEPSPLAKEVDKRHHTYEERPAPVQMQPEVASEATVSEPSTEGDA